MSSSAASCSICCHPASCVSATSASSPTAAAPRCCRCAVSCWATQRERQLRRPNRLPKRPIHSGTARSAEAPCVSSNGYPPPNSSFAHHRNQTSAQHKASSISAALARASARTQIPCLICPKTLAQPLPQLPMVDLLRSFAVLSYPQTRRPNSPDNLRGTSVPEQTHSKCIAPHRGGFLQVVVSEAPNPRSCGCAP